MADVAGIPASPGAAQTRAGSGDAATTPAADSAAPAFKATDYTALLAALGEAGRFEARSGAGAASPLRRTRREGPGGSPSSAAVLRDRLRGGELPAAPAAAETVRPAGAVIAPPGKSARGPGPIATMVIAYLALVAVSGGTIFYVWGGEHTSLTSIAAAMQRFRTTVADAVATRLPADGDEAAAVPPSPSASVAIREIPTTPTVAPDASVEVRRGPVVSPAASRPVAEPPPGAEPPPPVQPPTLPIAAAPVPALAVPAAAASVAALSAVDEPPPAVEKAPTAALPVATEQPSVPPAPPAAATVAAVPLPAPLPSAVSAAPASSVVSPVEIAGLLHRGDELVATGDIAAARLFFRRAVDEGSSRAATALGKTYDPAFLKQIGVRGGGVDAAKAAEWYRRASESGDAEATARLKALRVGTAR
jgi:hypothetical protein